MKGSRNVDVLFLSDCYRVEGRIFNESNQPTRALESSKNAKLYADQAIAQGLLDEHDSRLPRILTGWGNALNQLEQYSAALELQLEAIKLCREAPDGESDAITIVRLNWAYLLLRCGDLDQAMRILQVALEDDPDVPYVLYPLGEVYRAYGRFDEALAVHKKAYDLYVAQFGDQIDKVADSLYKLGEILFVHKEDAKQAL